MNLDKQNLSKKKHIYHVYTDNNGTLHCEKHPVIYINEYVVYYKQVRKSETLGMVHLGCIIHDISDYTSYRSLQHRNAIYTSVDVYLWNVDEANLTVLYDMMTNANKKIILSEAKRKVETAERNLKHAVDNLKAIEERVGKLEGKE